MYHVYAPLNFVSDRFGVEYMVQLVKIEVYSHLTCLTVMVITYFNS